MRPGKKTAEYIDRMLTRITLPGAIFLALISVLPDFLIRWFNTPFYFGGTSLLIVVGVALDTVRQMESHLLMRNYEGFLRKKAQGRMSRVIFLGAPGAGKGTQARRLAAGSGVPQVATGDMLREAAAAGTPLGREAKRYMDSGALVPDEVVIGLVDERLAPARRRGGLRAGRLPAHGGPGRGPRRAAARGAARSSTAWSSSTSRATSCCAASPGAGSAGSAAPPSTWSRRPRRWPASATSAAASSTSARTTRRPRWRTRLDVYQTQTAPLLDYYRERGLLAAVAGEGPVDGVAEAIRKAVREPVAAVILLKSARELGAHARGRAHPRRGEGPAARAGAARASRPRRSTRTWRPSSSPAGAVSAFKGYRGFPATVCISINEEVVHGIPSRQAEAAGGRHRGARPRVYRGGVLR